MLILKRWPRRPGQDTITIGDDITITVVRIQQGGVYLGIDCPREIPINRRDAKRQGKSNDRN